MTTINTISYMPQATLDLPQQKKGSDQVYFQGSKKNQLNDMKKYFKSILSDPDKESKRKQIIKKIISYTTLGIDTSRMFPQMVLASATKDLVQKKLIYFYLTIYSNSNENFARMTINTFMKDAQSPNPNIRALSIRQLSNLRFKGRQQYVLPILKRSLMDFSPIVRKSSIMGLTKIISQKNRKLQQPERDEDMLNSLYSLIRDPDSNVVCTVLEAINQIQPQGIAMSKKLAQYLLQNLNNYNDYQLPIILKYFQIYQHKTEQEALSTMNILYPKINSPNLAVTLQIIKIYIKFGQIYPQHLQNIFQRLKKPLLSFLNNEVNQIEFVALKHIQHIIRVYKTDIFKKDIKQFFILSKQTTYVKAAKIRIMQLNTDQSNFSDMINQFAQYISDEQISKQAILAMERIMMASSQNDSKFIVKTIIKIIESTHNDFLCNNALPTFRNFLRKYPKEFQLFQSIFYYIMGRITQNQAKCAMIQIIGDFGQHIQEAVQLLAWSQNQVSDTLKICLLRANVKLFFKRPVQMINMLTHLFNSILNNDQTHLYVRDYAAFLYRGLQSDIQNFKTTFLQTRNKVQIIPTQQTKLSINTLQVLYGQQEHKWLIEKDKYLENIQEVDYIQAEAQKQLLNEQIEEALQKKNSINVDSKFKSLEADDFNTQFQIDPDHFQNLCQNLQVVSSITRMIKNIDLITQENLEQVFKIWNIGVMASADDQESIKLYLYCKVNYTQGTQISIMQFQVLKLPQTMTMIVKSQNQEISGFISKYIQEFLKLNEII